MIVIDRNKCTGCGVCAQLCLAKAVAVKNGFAEIRRDCFMCGHCAAACPAGAVRIDGDGYSADEAFPYDPDEKILSPEQVMRYIRTRRSVRLFRDEPVPDEVLRQLVEAGRFSPTASNAQNVSYIVLKDSLPDFNRLAMREFRSLRGDEQAFAAIFPPPFSLSRVDFDDDDFLFKGARAVIFCLSPSDVNAAIAAAHMELLAVSLGYGAVYSGFAVRQLAGTPSLRARLGLREAERAAVCLCLGRPAVRFYRTVSRKKPAAKWL